MLDSITAKGCINTLVCLFLLYIPKYT